MSKVALVVGAYYHPPSAWDNLRLEDYYQNNCKQFLTLFYLAKDLTLSLHLSGFFLDWLSLSHPEYIKAFLEMQKDRRLELLGGAFSAPILPLIPHNDRIGQIEAQTTLMRKITGRRPRGAWIVRGIWEENLPFVLRTCGMEYSFLPEESFRGIGVEDPCSVFRPCLTESQGKVVTILPYSSRLADSAFWGQTDALWNLVENLERHDKSLPVICLFLDGSRLLDAGGVQKLIAEARDRFTQTEILLPSSVIKKASARLKHHFFATSGYREMKSSGAELGKSEEERTRSNYKQILSASPGFDQLYAKMIHVNFLAWQVRGDKYRKKSVLDELWLAQDHHHFFIWNDAHYLDPLLRGYVMKQLITAEAMSRDKSSFVPYLSQRDFDLDGRMEYSFAGNIMNVAVSSRGAQILDWDVLDKHLNISWAPTTENEESRRHSLADYWGPGLEIEDWSEGKERVYDRLWKRDFKVVRMDREKNILVLGWKGMLQTDGPPQLCRLEKTFHFQDDAVMVGYVMENLSPLPLRGRFGPEWRLNLLSPSNSGRQAGVSEWAIELGKGKNSLVFSASLPAELFHAQPLEGWGHFHRVLFLWDLDLAFGESFHAQVSMARVRPKPKVGLGASVTLETAGIHSEKKDWL